MQAGILKCKPGTRFHLGKAAMRQNESLTDTAEIIHSDVLFAAFINAIAQQLPEEIDSWKNHLGSGKIRFYSAFYCLEQNEKYTYLFPKPIKLNTFYLSKNDELKNAHKELKKIRYLSKGVWEKGLLAGKWFDESGPCLQPEKRVIMLKEELSKSDNHFQLSKKSDTQKVKVRTEEDEGNLYTQTDLVIMGNEGLKVHWYFIADMTGLSDEEKKTAKALIEDMALQGIGGERSTGCGGIEKVDYDESFALPVGNNSSHFITLSLTIPTKQDKENLTAYQVVPRGGMYYGDKKQINMIDAIAEGAIAKSPLQGRVVDLSKDDRKHWRGGTAFCLPLSEAYNF